MTGDAWNLVEEPDDQVAPFVVDVRALLQKLLRPFKDRNRCGLTQGADSARGLPMDIVHCCDQLFRTAAVTDAPASHRIGL